MEQTNSQTVIDIINDYKAKGIFDFALSIKLDGEKGQSRAWLQEKIKEVVAGPFVEHGVTCLNEKINWSYVEKDKTTYFSAILFCRIQKGN